ncbi:MAG: glutamine--fructose-6-phosphate transaminase (isomerizing) [Desulfovibrionaceae bacterium]|nr:glutamine--fructose-6-phosphate transaminase (isomerizing) [Desulfovibrionaceae bacterium]
MCGIFGYIGSDNGIHYTLEALQLMEYRGYDSAGIVFEEEKAFTLIKTVGKVAELKKTVNTRVANTTSSKALGHTRWATHGIPCEKNAHPHQSNDGSVVIVHNGIIENYQELRTELVAEGYSFISDTDTEILVNYIEYMAQKEGGIKQGLVRALQHVKGAFAIALMSTRDTSSIYAMRRGAPLLLGIGKGEYFLASDMCAFLQHTNDVIFLDENELVTLHDTEYSIESLYTGERIDKSIESVDFDIQSAQKQGYAHYMLKEIYEQPDVIEQSLIGKLSDGKIVLSHLPKEQPPRIHIIACGTSYYAGLWGKYAIEELAGIPVEVEIASEFRYRKKALDKNTLVLAITQSGETADTVAGCAIARELGCKTMAICNVVGSTITRMVDTVLYTQAGPEISVASTKAMTSQMIALLCIALHYSSNRESEQYREYIGGLQHLASTVRDILPQTEKIARQYAELCKDKKSFFYLGRGYCYPLALEGALKLKELTYIHAEGYPAGEMKHGPIALVEKSLMTIALLFDDEFGEKTQSAISEIQAREGQVIAIAPLGLVTTADFEWHLPKTVDLLQSFIMLPALQLLSYSIACLLDRNVDMPRNLAKSVTVE